MSMVNLQGYKVDRIEFVSLLENGTKISLGNKYSYNVQYAKDANMARGEFDIEVHDKDNPDKFKIRVVVVGIFSYLEGSKKELIHAETFKALFPYAKALVTTVTANCGIKPIMIPEIDIDNQQIYRFDKNPEQ
ncbi:MAG: protein-export chaperone SecB [Ruminococcus sp.]|nr:protein-export chaperone SecB [Ruminococcus sp.]